METFEAVRTLLAVRSYQDKPIPPHVVKKIVDSAWLTASSMNAQPWHFVVVEDRDTLRQMGEIATTGRYTAQAPLAVVVLVEKSSRFGVSDGSRAIQSMMLTAWSEGVGSNWVGFRGLEPVKDLLKIPAEFEILAIIPFGYPADEVGRGKKNRKRLSEVVSSERFGQPFA